MQNTLDLLSQVLFVALMAMFLYVLYRRFIAMLSKDRIAGDYARVVDLRRDGDRLMLVIEVKSESSCTVQWEGGPPVTLDCPVGESVHLLETGESVPEQVQLDFGNQVVRRRLS